MECRSRAWRNLELLDVSVVLLIIVCLSGVDLDSVLLNLVHYLDTPAGRGGECVYVGGARSIQQPHRDTRRAV